MADADAERPILDPRREVDDDDDEDEDEIMAKVDATTSRKSAALCAFFFVFIDGAVTGR